MRIGVLTTGYPRFEHDTAGLFVRSMARALVERGHQLEVLAPAPKAGPGAPISPPEEPGIAVHWVSYGPSAWQRTFYGAGVLNNLRDPRAWPGLVSFPLALLAAARSRVHSWDAIISHFGLPSALAAGAVRGDRPHLAVMHSADVFLLTKLPGRAWWTARIGSSASELLFASAAHRAQFLAGLAPVPRARIAGRCHASAMGVDKPATTKRRRTLRKSLGFTRFTVLALGRLVPIKGLCHAVESVRDLTDVELIIAGDGPERRALEGAPHTRLLGAVGHRQKSELLRAADAFIVPSVELPSGRTEGTPVAALEAAHAGLPIIASDTAGLAEVFRDHRSALLVPPADVRALRQAITDLRDDAALRRRLGRAARTAAKPYLWSNLAPRVEALLDVRGVGDEPDR